MSIRKYKMSVSSVAYDEKDRRLKEYELHFSAIRYGDISSVRHFLAERGIQYFQHLVYRSSGKWIPRQRCKVNFEREEYAGRVSPIMSVLGRRMVYVNDRWESYHLTTRPIYCAPRRSVRWVRRPVIQRLPTKSLAKWKRRVSRSIRPSTRPLSISHIKIRRTHIPQKHSSRRIRSRLKTHRGRHGRR
jgi:hypothetical protein